MIWEGAGEMDRMNLALAFCVAAGLVAVSLAALTSCAKTLPPSHPEHAAIVAVVRAHTDDVLGPLDDIGGYRVRAGRDHAEVDYRLSQTGAALVGVPFRTELTKEDGDWRAVRTRDNWGLRARVFGEVSNSVVWEEE